MLITLIVALCLVSPLHAASSTSNPPPQNKPQETGKQASNDKHDTKESPLSVDQISSTHGDKQTAEDKGKKDEELSTDKSIIKLTGLLVVAGFLQVVVICLQSWILWRQTGILGRQSNLLERQTKVQEATMAQWVDMDNWSNENTAADTLAISFQLVNPTGYSLTMTHAELEFSPMEPNQRTIFVYRRTPLPPNRPLAVTVPIVLNQQRMETFRKRGIGLGIKGTIVFISALQLEIVQEFTGVVTCSRTETKFEPSITLRQHEGKNA